MGYNSSALSRIKRKASPNGSPGIAWRGNSAITTIANLSCSIKGELPPRGEGDSKKAQTNAEFYRILAIN